MKRLGRRGWGTALAACGLAAAGTSTVVACTGTMGNLSVTPTSGPAGSTITTSATGLVSSGTYALHLARSTSTNCMSFTGVFTIATIRASSTGTWSDVTAVIPATASRGTHNLCGMEIKPMKGESGTSHETFTVV